MRTNINTAVCMEDRLETLLPYLVLSSAGLLIGVMSRVSDIHLMPPIAFLGAEIIERYVPIKSKWDWKRIKYDALSFGTGALIPYMPKIYHAVQNFLN